MAVLTGHERTTRQKFMALFGEWLKENDRTQKWASTHLGVYSGYLSNLVTGKQVASARVCRIAGRLMGPLDMTTGRPYGTAWTAEEARDKAREDRREADKKLHQRLRKKTKNVVKQQPMVKQKPSRGRIRRGWKTIRFVDIEQTRLTLGFSIEKMADTLRIMPSTFYRWRRGESVPHDLTQQRIKLILDSLEPRVDRQGPSTVEINAAVTVVVALINAGYRMTPTEVIGVIKGLINSFKLTT